MYHFGVYQNILITAYLNLELKGANHNSQDTLLHYQS